MLAIIKRCLPWYIAHLLTYGFLCFRTIIFNPEAIIIASIGLPIWMSSAIYWTEQGESESLLRSLPVSDRRIVRTKFSLALGFLAICICLQVLAGMASGFLSGDYALALTLVGFSGCSALLIAAIAYLGIWFIGTEALSWVFLIFHIGGTISFVSFWAINRKAMLYSFESVPFLGALTEIHWSITIGLLACAVLGFYGLSGLAVRIRRLSDPV